MVPDFEGGVWKYPVCSWSMDWSELLPECGKLNILRMCFIVCVLSCVVVPSECATVGWNEQILANRLLLRRLRSFRIPLCGCGILPF